MKKLIFPVVLGLIGLGAGVGAGIYLRPAATTAAAVEMAESKPAAPPEYVKLNNQFVIPVVEDGNVSALVVLSLSLEVTTDSTETVFATEPKLRDVFLQVLFDHANTGGFKGSFTDASNLVVLRQALKEGAMQVLADRVKEVLIVDIARQDS